MVEFDLSKITGREPPTDDGLPCACEWNAAGEPVGLCAAHQSKLDDELAALRAERDELRSWKAGSLEAARESGRSPRMVEMIRKVVKEYKRTMRTFSPQHSYRTDCHTEHVRVESWLLFGFLPVYSREIILATNI